jgi:uncharacterized damage-inducible protein DinB
MSSEHSREALLAALEREREALLALLPRFDEETWRDGRRNDGWSAHDITMHLADSTYGLARITLGEIPPAAPTDERGWMQVDELNQARREKNAELTREKAMSRFAASFEHGRRAIEQVDDLAAAGPTGGQFTKGDWLARLVEHNRMHREELERMLAP